LLVIVSNLPFEGIEKPRLPRRVVKLVMLRPKRSLLLLGFIGENPEKENIAEVIEPVEQVGNVGRQKIMTGVVEDKRLSGKIRRDVRASCVIVTTSVTGLENGIENVVAGNGRRTRHDIVHLAVFD